MNNSKHPPESHSHHPQTFDELITKGFPADEFARQADDYSRRTADAALMRPRASDLEAAGVAPTTLRKDAESYLPQEQAAYRNAVSRLVADGTYARLVTIHADMSHNMHGSMGVVGLYRFLAWHRRYLLEFERELQRADAELRPGAAPIAVPHWRWPRAFPAWLSGFLPARNPITGAFPPPRKLAPPPEKALLADELHIVNGYLQQLPGQNAPEYVRFTYGLEGWGIRPNGSSLPAHNHGHAWIGGVMNDTRASPTDPAFWLLHAEVDRLWHLWQTQHPDQHPPLAGNDATMDPWTERYVDLVDIQALGYSYANLSIGN